MGLLDGIFNGFANGISDSLNTGSVAKMTSKEVVGGKTLEQWDKEWFSIGKLKTANLTPYNKQVGLYKHIVNGKLMYIGRALEYNNGGFRKRLSDYRRQSDSARGHSSGKEIHAHLDDIETYLLVVGSTKAAAEYTEQLEKIFIDYYKPEWNVQYK